jgi:hypothetical protein
VAERLYRELGINRAADALGGPPDIAPSSCLSSFDLQYTNNADGGDIDYAVIASGLRDFARTRMRIALDDPGVTALRELPAPALGALDACIFGSLLAPLCRSIALGVADRATQYSSAEMQRVRSLAKVETERIACKVLDLPDAATARRAPSLNVRR